MSFDVLILEYRNEDEEEVEKCRGFDLIIVLFIFIYEPLIIIMKHFVVSNAIGMQFQMVRKSVWRFTEIPQMNIVFLVVLH